MLTLGDPGYELWYRFSHGEKGGLDHPVIARWERTRALRAGLQAAPGALTPSLSFAERRARTSNMLKQGCDLLKVGAEELRRRGCALMLADADGVLMAAYGADALPNRFQDAMQEGVRWDEAMRGTNAIGTALAEDTAVTVVGRAHYDPGSHGLVCYAAPVHDADGHLLAVLDVSGPVSAADPLLGVTVQSLAAAIEGVFRARALEQLEGQLRLNETFVATVGHDLRNPLTAVLNSVNLMLDRPGDASQHLVAQRIRSSGLRMSRMVDQLSDLARGRLGDGLHLAPVVGVDLTAVVDRVVAELSVGHPERMFEVVAAGDPLGRWDPVRLEQVVSNLAGNAVRHGSASKPVRISIDGSWADRVFLKVANGGEIAAAVLPYLFEPFHPAKEASRTREGLGLGLYIAKQVVDAHEGSIEVLTARGETTFCVALPREV